MLKGRECMINLYAERSERSGVRCFSETFGKKAEFLIGWINIALHLGPMGLLVSKTARSDGGGWREGTETHRSKLLKNVGRKKYLVSIKNL